MMIQKAAYVFQEIFYIGALDEVLCQISDLIF